MTGGITAVRVRARQRTARIAVAALAAALVLGPLAALPQPARADVTPTVCPPATALVNSGFEQPALAYSSGFFDFVNESAVPGWKTTASDNLIEIWATGWNGVPAAKGSQFAELNATQASTLYQDVAVTPGQTLRWQLQHRGRNGVDTMSVSIGPVGGPLVTQATFGDGQSWGTHSGVYTVPAGMTVARFAFGSVSTANGIASEGNFLDDITFGSAACVAVDYSASNLTRAGSNRSGDVVQFESAATNDGGTPAGSVVLSTILPTGLTLVPGSLEIVSASGVTTALSAATDADAGEYVSGTREIRARVGSVAPGETVRLRYRATIASAAADSTILSHSTASYTEPLTATTPSADSTEVSLVVTPTADLGVTATLDAALWGGGLVADEAAQYTIDLTQSGPEVAKSATLAIDLPPLTGRVVTPSAGTCTVTGDHADCVFGDLAPGATRSVSVSGTVPAGTTAADTFDLVATAATTSADPASGNDSAALSTPGADPVSSLSVVASSTVDPIARSAAADLGDQVTTSYVVTNTGNRPLTGLSVTDDRNAALECVDTDLPRGASTTCTAATPFVIDVAMIEAGTPVATTGTASATPTGETAAITSAPATTTVPLAAAAPTVSIDAQVAPTPGSGHPLPWAGDDLDWTATVSNSGNVTLSDITVTNDRGSTYTCADSVLAPGTSTSCSADPAAVTYADVAAGSASATVTVAARSASGAIVSAGDAAVQPVAAADRRLDVVATSTVTPASDSASLEVGDVVAIEYVVTNVGNIPLDALTVTDDAGSVITCAATSLAPGESTTCTATDRVVTQADVDAGADLRVEATASADPADGSGPVASGPAVTSIPVAAADPALDLDISSWSPSTHPVPQVGELVYWAFVVTNAGNVTVTLEDITDDFGSTIACDVSTLAPGDSADCEAAAPSTVTLAEATAGSSTNSATVTGRAPDSRAVSASATHAQSTGMPTPALEITGDVAALSGTTPVPGAGDRLRATYVVTNTGNVDVDAIAVSDSVFGGVECAAETLEIGESMTCVSTAPYVVTDADVAAGRVETSAEVVGDLPTLGLTVRAETRLSIAAGATLAFTGSTLGVTPVVGAGLVLLGLLLVVARRRRRAPRHRAA